MSQSIPNVALVPPGAGAITPAPASRPATAPAAGPAFADVLARTQTTPVQAPTFSRHALERVSRRGIDLSPTTLARLSDGIARAAGKGSRASVVFVDKTAFVVAVPNNTVVTAVDSEHMREQVFTNIDSAVIA